MFKINENFKNITESYLFSDIARRVSSYLKQNPGSRLIRLGIGDVTLPLGMPVIDALVTASKEQAFAETFRGYGPEQGHRFLRELIIENDYALRGVTLDSDEVFISDGAKSDLANFGDILSVDNLAAITNPVYPVYLDTNILVGRRVMMLPCCEDNGFIPQLPVEQHPDLIYLCYPNNPTGVAMTKVELKRWVDYANERGALILFDSAYEAYISDEDIPHSIYEIEGAKGCAIEFRSYSKTAGFTGLRCGYTVVPKDIQCNGLHLNDLWRRRQSTKFNGASYVVQRAAAALYTEEGRRSVRDNIDYYMSNARLLKGSLGQCGLKTYGGVNSPYVWVKTPGDIDSWTFFDILLNDANVVTTPGVGFGSMGEGYIRLTGFGSHESTKEAASRITQLLNE
ncbi:MAG: LL-diaminopimelate aminotransferase [Muribaculaceae bacterium]|nr:LL-diaminopimelate aminotransferase [Muribaculaceae bacterium]